MARLTVQIDDLIVRPPGEGDLKGLRVPDLLFDIDEGAAPKSGISRLIILPDGRRIVVMITAAGFLSKFLAQKTAAEATYGTDELWTQYFQLDAGNAALVEEDGTSKGNLKDLGWSLSCMAGVSGVSRIWST